MKDFPFSSPIFLTHWVYTCIKKGCKCLSSKWFFTILNKTLKFKMKKNPRKMHFTAIHRLKFEKASLQSSSWGHHFQPTEPLNWLNSKETEPYGGNSSRWRSWIKAWVLYTVKCQNIYNCSHCDFIGYEICQKRDIIFQINLLI